MLTRALPSRCWMLVLAHLAVLALWLSGLSVGISTLAYTTVLHWMGPGTLERLGPVHYAMDGHEYVVVYWCTPSSLCFGGFTLIWLAGQRARDYFVTCVAFALAVSVGLLINAIISAWVRKVGLTWNQAHIPGTVALYLGAFAWCLMFAFGRVEGGGTIAQERRWGMRASISRGVCAAGAERMDQQPGR